MNYISIIDYTIKMTTEVDTIFNNLLVKLKTEPEEAEKWVFEAKEAVLQWVQNKNHSIFEDLLTQMTPLTFENNPE